MLTSLERVSSSEVARRLRIARPTREVERVALKFANDNIVQNLFPPREQQRVECYALRH